jgi:hypothetical protein
MALVDPAARTVQWQEGQPQAKEPPGHDVHLVCVVYLLEAKEMRPSGQWVTAQSLRAGDFFFRGLHELPTGELARAYGSSPQAFLAAGRRLGGRVAEGGDACCELQVLPRIAIRLVLWTGDEEFPARVNMLFDSLADEHLPLDVIHTMARHVVKAMLRAGQQGP